MKYLLLLALAGLVWWIWSKRRPVPPERRERPAERIVRCAHCGVHLPEGEALAAGDRRYCCEAHRQAAAGEV